MAATGNLRVRLLGPLEVVGADGGRIDVPGKKTQALLAFLAANAGRAQPREKLAALLWGDRFDEQSRQSLRQAILKLRKSLGQNCAGVLQVDGDQVKLDAEAAHIDLIEFERSVAEACLAGMMRAASLYRGSLLEGFALRETGFQEWIDAERARLQQMGSDVLASICRSQEDAGDVAAALATAQRLVTLDPLRESAHRALMRLYVCDGQRTLALKQYRTCVATLKTEVGAEPEAETQRLHDEIRRGEAALPPPTSKTRAPQASAGSGPPVPATPSIAVLPFANLSGDPEQEYFSDGITDDLTTALSNVRTFLVIARQSAFAYKGRAKDVKDIGRELGVRYVLEGSVRKAGNQVRVSAQLVEAATGTHIWADRYDGSLDDIFDLQESIAVSVAGAIEPMLHRAEFDRIRQKRPENFDAYDLTLYGLAKMNRLTPQDTEEALQYFLSATEIDPGYARAFVCASYCYRRRVQIKGLYLSETARAEAVRLARAGLRLNPTDPFVLWQSALTFALVEKDFDEALMLVDRSLSINSASNRAWIASGMIRCYAGDPECAIEHAEKAIRLSPLDVSMWVAFWVMATGHLQLGNYEEAAEWAAKSLKLHPDNLSARYVLAASLAQSGKTPEAEAAIAGILEADPDTTIRRFAEQHPVARYRKLDGFLDGLRKAGLPD